MKKNTPAVLLLFASSFLADASVAQTLARTPEQVQVDLLVFRHNTATQKQINDIASVPPRPGATFREEAGEGNETPIFTTEGLEEQSRKIEESAIFDLLYRVSWRQPVYALQDAPYVSLAPQKRTGLLQAAVKVSFDRYFRLVIDLLYDPYLNASTSIEQDAPENRPLFIRMQEVVTDGTLYYLDYPLLGVIAKLTKVKDAAEPE